MIGLKRGEDLSDVMVVVGSINTDLVIKSERIPKPGENICGTGFSMVPGGKGANQAVAAKRLGAEVYFLGCVGKDLFGDFLISNLERCGVSTAYIKMTEERNTGTALIVVEEDTGVNTIVVDPGANMALTAEDLNALDEILQKASVALFQLEIPTDVIVEGSWRAKEKGLITVLDAGPPRGMLFEALEHFDIVSPNLGELASLTGYPVNDVESAKEAAFFLCDSGVPKVVVKMGEQGALLVERKKAIHCTAFSVQAVDATAAGDAFTAALALSVARGRSMRESVLYANAAGAHAVTVFGAQPSMPTSEDVRRVLSREGGECFEY